MQNRLQPHHFVPSRKYVWFSTTEALLHNKKRVCVLIKSAQCKQQLQANYLITFIGYYICFDSTRSVSLFALLERATKMSASTQIITSRTFAANRLLIRLVKNGADNKLLIGRDLKCRSFSVQTVRSMRFVQFRGKNGGPQHLGAQLAEGGDIFDISAVDSSIPNSLVKFLRNGNEVLETAKR